MPIDLQHSTVTRRIKTSVALPPDLREEAHKVASKYGVSLSEYIVRLLRSDLQARKEDLDEGASFQAGRPVARTFLAYRKGDLDEEASFQGNNP